MVFKCPVTAPVDSRPYRVAPAFLAYRRRLPSSMQGAGRRTRQAAPPTAVHWGRHAVVAAHSTSILSGVGAVQRLYTFCAWPNQEEYLVFIVLCA